MLGATKEQLDSWRISYSDEPRGAAIQLVVKLTPDEPEINLDAGEPEAEIVPASLSPAEKKRLKRERQKANKRAAEAAAKT